MSDDSQRKPGGGKAERYLQPSLLLALYNKPDYGYELIKSINEYGFIQGDAPPGMIYRHLRQLEEDGMVSSNWDTQESGPAKRVYELTAEGRDALAVWIDYMNLQIIRLQGFINRYEETVGKSG